MAGDDEDWLTPPKATELLHLKPKTLQEYCVSGAGAELL